MQLWTHHIHLNEKLSRISAKCEGSSTLQWILGNQFPESLVGVDFAYTRYVTKSQGIKRLIESRIAGKSRHRVRRLKLPSLQRSTSLTAVLLDYSTTTSRKIKWSQSTSLSELCFRWSNMWRSLCCSFWSISQSVDARIYLSMKSDAQFVQSFYSTRLIQ
jgi:hypothetical protein